MSEIGDFDVTRVEIFSLLDNLFHRCRNVFIQFKIDELNSNESCVGVERKAHMIFVEFCNDKNNGEKIPH